MSRTHLLSPSLLVWITGLSGAGKTTIAREVVALIRSSQEAKGSAGTSVVHLDGDAVREVMGNDLGHTHDDRVKSAYRLCRLAKLLTDQGVTVICSTMSLYPEIWAWNRAHFARYLEVYIKVSPETVRRRDPKGIYRRAAQGAEQGVIGGDLAFVEPTSPHLVISNDAEDAAGPSSAAATILQEILRYEVSCRNS